MSAAGFCPGLALDARTACSLLKYVTRFPCETFGFYVAWIYVQYGVQVITRQFNQVSDTSAFLGIM